MTDDEVRGLFQNGTWNDGLGNYDTGDQFDAWLAEVRATAWDEGHEVARMADPVGCTCAYMECWCDANYEQTFVDTRADNPYRTNNEGKSA